MNRYNIFNQIHKALRVLLYETAIAVQQTDFNNKEEAKEVLNRLEMVVEMFDKHADTEDSLVLPAIAEYEPSVVNVFEEEHVADHKLSQQLKDLLFVYTHSEMDETRVQTGFAISLAFTAFLVFNLNHMAKEEKVLNKLLWRYYSDEQLHQLTIKIVAKQSPEAMSIASKWMMRGLNNPEIITWLKEVRNTAPDFVLKGLSATAEKELTDKRWKFVHEQALLEKAVA
jgi:hypothetical protein